jgi:hypothetical protein
MSRWVDRAGARVEDAPGVLRIPSGGEAKRLEKAPRVG